MMWMRPALQCFENIPRVSDEKSKSLPALLGGNGRGRTCRRPAGSTSNHAIGGDRRHHTIHTATEVESVHTETNNLQIFADTDDSE